MKEWTKRISFRISSNLSNMVSEPDLHTGSGSDQKVPAPAPQHWWQHPWHCNVLKMVFATWWRMKMCKLCLRRYFLPGVEDGQICTFATCWIWANFPLCLCHVLKMYSVVPLSLPRVEYVQMCTFIFATCWKCTKLYLYLCHVLNMYKCVYLYLCHILKIGKFAPLSLSRVEDRQTCTSVFATCWR